jgi:imidazoleglycerol-phosphate dehydratase/histidinol-phosphatase
MKKVLFIDRDGTLIEEPADEQVDSFEKLRFIPGAITWLSRIATELDYELVMVTNQDGLGTSSFPEETFWPVHKKVIEILKGENVIFSEIFIDRTFPEDNAPTRKPGTAMLTRFLSGGVDLSSSYVIGDRQTDIEFAANLGCNSIFFSASGSDKADLSTHDWKEVYLYLRKKPRTGYCKRETNETSVEAMVNLDGTGKAEISTGIGFLDHLLGQLPKHGNMDISLFARGDLEVDEHHTVEDIALALGRAFSEALGKKKGIERYGFTLPMDDCLAAVALDFSGRPWLAWDAAFKREKVGELPSEMFKHFFKSFSDTAGCNLNIRAEGENEHHKIEAIFKAFARALKMAVSTTDNYSIPSSKGSL